MKLSAREAAGFFRAPDKTAAGVLISGEDPMRVALRRAELLDAVLGQGGEEEMRLTRIQAGELRKDAALLQDAIKAQGFFPGPRVALVEDATDGLTAVIKEALTAWAPGDAMIVVTAGNLTTRASLRKLFESGKTTYAAALYNDPPGRAEIEAELARAGLGAVPAPALAALHALATALGPGDFRQTVEKLALYMRDATEPLSVADIEACAPASTEAAIDDALDVVTEGRTADLAKVMQRLWAQGTAPVTLLIFATRRFRALYTVVTAPGGAAKGIGLLRPPVFGPRRDRLLRQADRWTPTKLDDALTLLMDTDLSLRSAGQTAPTSAVVERALVRLAYLASR